MAKRGRPPKPKELKELQGTIRPCRDRPEVLEALDKSSPFVPASQAPIDKLTHPEAKAALKLTFETLANSRRIKDEDLAEVLQAHLTLQDYFYAQDRSNQLYAMENKTSAQWLEIVKLGKYKATLLHTYSQTMAKYGVSPSERARLFDAITPKARAPLIQKATNGK